MEELVYHLTAPLAGTNKEMISDYLIRYGLIVVLIFILFFVVFLICKKFKKAKWFYIFSLVLLVIGIVFSVNLFDKKVGFFDYMKAQRIPSTFIEDNYVAPQDVEMVFPSQKRNLIYIYLESMEMTFTSKENGGAFNQNIIPELVTLSREGEDFSGDSEMINGGVSLYGSEWTMGAMFAQSTGLPLKVVGVNENYILTQSSMYPTVQSLGDILNENGYNNELLIGSSAIFGGRLLFYSGHGDYKIFDYDYALTEGYIPDDYYVWWGYEDSKLFDFAKEEINELSQKDEPFNITMLTVDTHFENGYLCEDCGTEYYDGDQYSNVMACSSKRVNDFIDWVKEQPFYDNTTIVIVGDHPTMDKDFCETVPEEYQRKVITSFINAPVTPEDNSRYREYSTMDIFPTTLAAMGVEIGGNKLGLGVNLFSNEDTLLEKYGVEYCNEEMKRVSTFMESLNTIEINDYLVANMGADSEITPVFDEDGLQIDFRVFAHFDELKGFKALEAEVWNEEDDKKTVELDGYKKNDYIYYNTEKIKDVSDKNLNIMVYMIDKDDNRFTINNYISE